MKKVIVACLALAMAASMAACSGEKPVTSTESDISVAEESGVSETSEEPEEDASEEAPEEISDESTDDVSDESVEEETDDAAVIEDEVVEDEDSSEEA